MNEKFVQPALTRPQFLCVFVRTQKCVISFSILSFFLSALFYSFHLSDRHKGKQFFGVCFGDGEQTDRRTKGVRMFIGNRKDSLLNELNRTRLNTFTVSVKANIGRENTHFLSFIDTRTHDWHLG